jgi:hypothetical protein
MIDDTPVDPEPSYDPDYDNTNTSSSSFTRSESKTISSPTASSAKKRPRRPPSKASSPSAPPSTAPTVAAAALVSEPAQRVGGGITSLSSSSNTLSSSFKTSSKVLDQRLTGSGSSSSSATTTTTTTATTTPETVAHDFGTSDAPIPEGKKSVRPRANIWGMKLERRSGVNRYGCPTWRVIVQDEVRITVYIIAPYHCYGDAHVESFVLVICYQMWVVLLVAGLLAGAFFIAKLVPLFSL